MITPFVGGTSNLRVTEQDSRRAINMIPAKPDVDGAKSPLMAEQVPGLTLFSDVLAECRGFVYASDRMFAVGGNVLYEVDSAGTAVSRGTLLTSTGIVSMEKNLTQVGIVDGVNGYCFDFTSNTFSQISDPGFSGSVLIAMSKGRAVFSRPGTQVFYVSQINDFLTFDALEFASAESSPDKIMAHIVDHENLFLFGTEVAEVYDNTGGVDFPLTKNNNASIQKGCAAPHSLVQFDNTIVWVGGGKDGNGIVWRMNGYSALRISTSAVEQLLQDPDVDLANASAFAVQDEGKSLYFLNVPGISTTLVYDSKTGLWHEWAELVDGEYQQFRAVRHVFAYEKHMLGDADGKIYYLDHTKNTFNGDVMCREIIGPHKYGQNLEKISINKFALDCSAGDGLSSGFAGQVMIKYSKNRGKTWSNWRYPNLGVVGDQYAIPAIYRLGQGRGWVIRARCTDDVPFNVLGASIT